MSSFDLLRTLIVRFPPQFLDELAESLRHRVEELGRDPTATREAIDEAVIDIGRQMWPYAMAWDELYARVGRVVEEERFLAALGHALGERVRIDAETAHVSPCDIARLPTFRQYSVEERFIINDALLRARRAAAETLSERIVSEGQDEYEAAVRRWEEERLAIDGHLFTLREFANTKPNLAAEIDRVVHEYELGFSRVVGREPSASELDRVVREYRTRDGRDE